MTADEKRGKRRKGRREASGAAASLPLLFVFAFGWALTLGKEGNKRQASKVEVSL